MAIRTLKRIRDTAIRMANGEWNWDAILNRELYPAIKAIIDALNQGGYTTIQDEGAGLTKQTTLNFIGPSVTAEDDEANNRTNVIIESGLASLTNFDTRNDPFFLYNFDIGVQNLGSAGSAGDLIAGAGAYAFTHIAPSRQGVLVPGPTNTYLEATAFSSALAHNGDGTYLIMVQLDDDTGSLAFLISHGAAGETAGTNVLYSLTVQTGAGIPRPFGWLSESGAGVNSTVDSASTFALPPIHNLMWLGVVRSETSVSVWINGVKNNTGSITAPTGGQDAASRLRIGGFPGFTTNQAVIFGAKGVARAYTDDEMRAEYNYTMGAAFGEV